LFDVVKPTLNVHYACPHYDPSVTASVSVKPQSTSENPHPRSALRDWISREFLVGVGSSERFESMEGLRGFSVILVFFVHYSGMVAAWLPESGPTSRLNSFLGWIGGAGVDLFFILSGFLIYSALLRKPRPYLRYFRRRLQRIYPPFLAVFALYLILSFAFPNENKIPPALGPAAKYLILNALLLPGVWPADPMITIAWSLSYELAFYLALPAVLAVFAFRRIPRVARIVLVAFAASAICLLVPRMFRAGMFAVGIFLAEWMIHRGSKLLPSLADVAPIIATIAVAALGVIGPPIAPGQATRVAYLLAVGTIFFPLTAATLFGQGRLREFFLLRPLRVLGNMSYSYYLVHGITLKGFFWALLIIGSGHGRSSLYFWALLPVAFALTILTSACLFLAVEKPYSLASPQEHAT
jgi:exopolysaccharide production protein ExoZ